MSMRLSSVQAEVLQHMAWGHQLFVSMNGAPWLHGVPGGRGLGKRVHTNTLVALRKRGYIERVDTVETWRRDYVITQAGMKALTDNIRQRKEQRNV